MPELPEVETVRRLCEKSLLGQVLTTVLTVPDTIVFQSPAEFVQSALVNQVVSATGRKGKLFWLTLRSEQTLYLHLGMSGWLWDMEAEGSRLLSHGKANFFDAEGKPRFLKLQMNQLAFTDGRRLARIRLGKSPELDDKVRELGPDAFTELPSCDDLFQVLTRKNSPIKSVLMDQRVLSGLGNWLADEILYQARVSPLRKGSELSASQVGQIHHHIGAILKLSVDVGADHLRYPTSWMFHHRWGGEKGSNKIDGQAIERTSIGSRTTAWVPSLQK